MSMERSWLLLIPATLIVLGIGLMIAIAFVWVLPWWGFMSAFLIITMIIAWLAVIYDLVQRADIPLWPKLLWGFFVLVIPFFALIAYFFTRPSAVDIRYHGDQPV